MVEHVEEESRQPRLSCSLDRCSAGEPPEILHVMTNWHHGIHLEMVLLDVAHISDDMLQLPVSVSTHLCPIGRLLLSSLMAHVPPADDTTNQHLHLCHD